MNMPILKYDSDATFIFNDVRYRACDFFIEDFMAIDDQSGINPIVVESLDMDNKEVLHFIFKDYEPDWHFENFGQYDKERINFSIRNDAQVECWDDKGPRLYSLPYERIAVRLFGVNNPNENILINENLEVIGKNLQIV